MQQPPNRDNPDSEPVTPGTRKLELVPARTAAKSHVSEHLANERTYLAYLRTAVSLISFGITINRFSIYLFQSKLLPERRHDTGLMGVERLGFGMVIFGICLLLWAAFHFSRIGKAIDQEDYRPQGMVIWIITFGVLLGGAVSLIWLFPGR